MAMNLPIYVRISTANLNDLDPSWPPHTHNASFIKVSTGFCNAVTRPEAAVNKRTRHSSESSSFCTTTVATFRALRVDSIALGTEMMLCFVSDDANHPAQDTRGI